MSAPDPIDYVPVLRARITDAVWDALESVLPGWSANADIKRDPATGLRRVVLPLPESTGGESWSAFEPKLIRELTRLTPLFEASSVGAVPWELDVAVMLPDDRVMHTLAFSWRLLAELAVLRVSLTTTTYVTSREAPTVPP